MDHLRPMFPPLDSDLERWTAVVLAAYGVGHLVFLVSSRIDALYDPFRKWLWGDDQEGSAYRTATQLRAATLGGTGDLPMNTFKWANALLVQKSPAAAVVHRFVADSKFFRSLIIVLMIVSVIRFSAGDIIIGFGSLLLMIPTFWRYAERRYKSTLWAYCHAIVYFKLAPTNEVQPPENALLVRES
jgi:hypothetical protein